MVVVDKFGKGGEVLASYEFVDIATGTGFLHFYCGDGTDAYTMGSFPFYSNTLASGGVTAGQTLTLLADIDFDVTVNQTITLYGTAIITGSMRLVAGAGNGNGYVIFKIRKDNGSEVELFTNTTDVLFSTAGTMYRTFCCEIPITTATPIKRGAILRLTAEVYGSPSAAEDTQAFLGHDPLNRITNGLQVWDADHPTKLEFYCPVRVED